MSIERQLKEQKQENKEIVEAILADGSMPDVEYTIEHHFSSTNFDRLEKAAVDAFKLGYEVNDAEEMELEDGSVIYCFDAVATQMLDTDLLDEACEKMLTIAAKHKIDYDGWGTYFIDENGEEVRDEDEYDDEEPLH
ncbi:ribonuclease E inhibitor RraB [Shewanella pneumatophori]|uniref:Regulator of ribonuclease activity B n=1 Tax=Shewanella pneumatophori TaxID=314092 RepID=A0A9X1ZK99_9GAMM|nr:ribonuclease E inhibitor RraB [Shewanella pneumatophori]MCL1139363.1 ribonuclease E inhibitor RraB [Shewanella pneumatophori]